MMAESIAQHQATLDVNAPRDFTDTMLIEILNTTDPASSFYGDFGIENLKNVMFDLFLAGSETTSTTSAAAAAAASHGQTAGRRCSGEPRRTAGGTFADLAAESVEPQAQCRLLLPARSVSSTCRRHLH